MQQPGVTALIARLADRMAIGMIPNTTGEDKPPQIIAVLQARPDLVARAREAEVGERQESREEEAARTRRLALIGTGVAALGGAGAAVSVARTAAAVTPTALAASGAGLELAGGGFVPSVPTGAAITTPGITALEPMPAGFMPFEPPTTAITGAGLELAGGGFIPTVTAPGAPLASTIAAAGGVAPSAGTSWLSRVIAYFRSEPEAVNQQTAAGLREGSVTPPTPIQTVAARSQLTSTATPQTTWGQNLQAGAVPVASPAAWMFGQRFAAAPAARLAPGQVSALYLMR